MGKSAARVTKPPKVLKVPPLRDGQRLNVTEFMQRYEAMPEGFRAELLNGVVYVNRWFETGPNGESILMPPISSEGHGRPQGDMSGIFLLYAAGTKGTLSSGPCTVRLPGVQTAPEPDAVLRLATEYGGRTRLVGDYVVGPPELVVEVARSSVPRDLGLKLDLYQQAGVQEYIVWRTGASTIDWFWIDAAGLFAPLMPDDDGVMRSVAFPGLWLEPTALTSGDPARIVEILQAGLASPEHVAFVAKLAKIAARKKR